TLTDMNGVISGLQSRTFDVGLGAISITPKREKLVDFTHAVNPSGTGIAVAKNSITPSFLKKWTPVLIDLLELIAGLLLMLLMSAIIVYYIEKHYTGREEKTDRNINSISDGLWWSAVTMTTVGYGDKVPRSRAGRVIGIIWIFISIIFFSLFTANTSAKLANSGQPNNPINSLEDLFNPNVSVVAVSKSSGEEYLIRENVNYAKKDDIQAAIRAVVEGEADAVVSNVPVLKYHNKTNFGGELLVAKALLLRNNMGIALQDESPLKEAIDLVLLQKISEPKWQAAVYKYIGE
ncbi:MAG: transporter substrate-binding domain-containing protein, partial [Bacteroidota bacterium]